MFDGCLYFNLSVLSKQITKIWNDEFALLGLSPSHGYLIMAIAKNPDASQKDLREILHMDASTVTRMIDALVSKGLLERDGAGKGSGFSLTVDGLSVAKKAQTVGLGLRDRMHETFSEDVFNDVVGKLCEMRETLKEKQS